MPDSIGTEAVDQSFRLRDGRHLGYAEYGDPAGVPAFYFHGFPGARLAAQLHASDAVDAGVRVIAPDRPGMGLSDFQTRRRIADWPADVSELANALSIDGFAVLGVSGGGPYALACASKIPERITLCGVISGMAPFAHVTQQMKATNETIFLIARKTPWLLRTLLWLGAGRYAGSEEAMQKQVRAGFGELPPPDRVLMEDASIERIVVAQAMEAYHRGAKGPAHEGKLLARDWGFRLEDISCENVRLWHGEMDVNVPAEAVRRLAKQITACKAIFYPEEAHLSTIVHHGPEFMAAVRQASATPMT